MGFCANVVALVFPEQDVWRYQLGSAFIPAVPLSESYCQSLPVQAERSVPVLIFLVPESPRWLMKKNRYPQAFTNFCKLRHTNLQAARDMYFAHAQLEVENSIVKADSYPRRFAELFTIPRVRRATIASGTGKPFLSFVCVSFLLFGDVCLSFFSATSAIFARTRFNLSIFFSCMILCADIRFDDSHVGAANVRYQYYRLLQFHHLQTEWFLSQRSPIRVPWIRSDQLSLGYP